MSHIAGAAAPPQPDFPEDSEVLEESVLLELYVLELQNTAQEEQDTVQENLEELSNLWHELAKLIRRIICNMYKDFGNNVSDHPKSMQDMFKNLQSLCLNCVNLGVGATYGTNITETTYTQIRENIDSILKKLTLHVGPYMNENEILNINSTIETLNKYY